MRILLAALLAFPLWLAQAAEVAGVRLDDRALFAPGGPELVLNGAGLRQRAFFKVYAMGLYLTEKKTSGAEVIALAGPKRVAIHMLRDVDADTFVEALADGINANHGEAEAKALEPRVRELGAIMTEVREAKEGMRIALEWQPGSGTRVTIDGKPAGKPIAGEDFYRALLRIWLGDNPVQADLKTALLGGKQ